MGLSVASRARPLLLLCLAACGVPPCLSMIHRLTYAEDTSRVFAIELFGFWRSGVINMTVFDYAKPPQAKHQMDLGIFVRKVRSQADAQTLVEESKTVGRCLMNSPENLYTVRLREQRDWKHRSRLLRTVRPGQEGLYLIAFSRCDRDPEANPISFKLDAEFSNPGSIVGDVNYLSAGMTGLPKLYALLFVVYIVMMLRWRSHLRAHAAKVHAIHHIMTLLVALKMLQMLFESIRYHFIQLAGVAPTWSAVFFFFTFLKSMTMFTVILLIGTGWSLLKHHITEREKNIIAGVLVLQVIDNLALVAVQSSSPGSKGGSRGTIFCISSTSCVVVLSFSPSSGLYDICGKQQARMARRLRTCKSWRNSASSTLLSWFTSISPG